MLNSDSGQAEAGEVKYMVNMQKGRFMVNIRHGIAGLTAVFLGINVAGSAEVEDIREQLKEEPTEALQKLEGADIAVQKKLVADVLELCSHRREKVTNRATGTLSNIAEEEPEVVVSAVTKRLKRALDDDELISSIRMLEFLSQLGPAAGDAVDELMTIARNENDTLSYWAVYTLGKIGPAADEAVPLLAEFSTDDNSFLRSLALKALESVATGEQLAKAIKPALKSDYDKTRTKALDFVEELGPKAKTTVPVLIKLLNKEDLDMRTRQRVIAALGAVRDPDTVSVLVGLLKSGNTHDQVKIASAAALHSIGKPAPEALKPLLNLAERADSEQKKTLVKAISTIKTSNAPPQVEQVKLDCMEGQSVVVEFPVTDEDDIEAAIKIEVTNEPQKGALTRKGPRSFKYESEYGHPGKFTFEGKATDAGGESSPAKAVIEVDPDNKAPKLLNAYARGKQASVVVVFDEPVLRKTAEKPENYTINGEIKVKNAKLGGEDRKVVLDTTELQEKTDYTLKVKNITDRAKAANTMQESQQVRFPSVPFREGLRYEYYEGDWNQLPNYDQLEAKERGIAERITASDYTRRNQHFALRFRGKITIQKEGTYTFWTVSDDGSMLYIDGDSVVDNGGMHGPRSRKGEIELEPGLHDITVEFVQGPGGYKLQVRWAPPDSSKEMIPSRVLRH
mgnify:CR=1 FL=1